jgi:hypothetical protein
VKFAAAAYFTLFAARIWTGLPPDVHVLKVDVPASATPGPASCVRLEPTTWLAPNGGGRSQLRGYGIKSV